MVYSLRDIGTQVLDAGEYITKKIAGDSLPGEATKYDFSFDVFPEDLGSSYYGHFMTMTAIQRSAMQTGAIETMAQGTRFESSQYSQYAVAFFIPSAESGSGIIYEDKHEYSDIKLSNLMGGAVGAIFGQDAVKAAAAGASLMGHPINPGVQVLFRTTNLRQFQFTFLMAPQSEKESNSMKSIVKKLRMFAAPELNLNNSAFFNTPCEFEIKFYNKGQENTNIPKIRRCVLTDVIADFTPQGEWSTFRNGHPVACQLSLAFQEMEIIHRKFVEDGY